MARLTVLLKQLTELRMASKILRHCMG